MPRVRYKHTPLCPLCSVYFREKRKYAEQVGHMSWTGGMILGIAEGHRGWDDVIEHTPSKDPAIQWGQPAIFATKRLRRGSETMLEALSKIVERTKDKPEMNDVCLIALKAIQAVATDGT